MLGEMDDRQSKVIRIGAEHSQIGSFAILALTALLVLGLALSPAEYLVRVLKDDAFYYFKTASNIASGLGPTFDNINKTNGFHPLWLLVLIPFYLPEWDNPALPLHMVMLVLAVLHVATSYILYYAITRSKTERFAALIALAAWSLSPVVLRIVLNGLESGMLAFVLSLIVLVISIRFKADGWQTSASPHSYALLGSLVGLSILVRLDQIFLLGALGLLLLPRLVRKQLWLRILAFLSCSLVPFSMYLAWNWITFGHLVPISGVVKNSSTPLSVEALARNLLWPLDMLRPGLPIASLAAIAVVLVLVIFCAIWLFGRGWLLEGWRRFDYLILASPLYYVYYSRSGSGVGAISWYYVPVLMMCLLMGALLLSHVSNYILRAFGRQSQKHAALSLLVVLLLGYSLLGFYEFHPGKKEIAVQRLHAAQWLSENTPKEAILASWNAGVIGYFSGRRVINLDGLINSYDYYYKALTRHRVVEFIEVQGVNYIVETFTGDPMKSSKLAPEANAWKRRLSLVHVTTFEAKDIGLSRLMNSMFPGGTDSVTYAIYIWRFDGHTSD